MGGGRNGDVPHQMFFPEFPMLGEKNTMPRRGVSSSGKKRSRFELVKRARHPKSAMRHPKLIFSKIEDHRGLWTEMDRPSKNVEEGGGAAD